MTLNHDVAAISAGAVSPLQLSDGQFLLFNGGELEPSPLPVPDCQSAEWVLKTVSSTDVVKLLSAAVRRKLHLFHHFPDVDFDDLLQEVTIKVLGALPRFNPEKASLSTFVSVVAGRAMLSILKMRSRSAKRDTVYAQQNAARQRQQ